MTASPHYRLRSFAAASGVASLLVVAPIALGLITPASAHSALESSSPKAGATVTTAPESVTLTFNEDIQDVGDGIVVTAPTGKRVDTGDTQIKGVSATQALKPLTDAGTYSVRYRIVSADGHVVNSSYRFVYEPATTATASAEPIVTDAQSTPAAATTTTDGSSSSAPAILGGIAILGAIGAVVGLVIRRRGLNARGANG